MKLEYDPQADAAYIYLQNKNLKSFKTIKVREFLLIDLGKHGEIIGVEILDASLRLPLKELLKKNRVKSPKKSFAKLK